MRRHRSKAVRFWPRGGALACNATLLLWCLLGLTYAAQAQPSSVLFGELTRPGGQPLEGGRVTLHPAVGDSALASTSAEPQNAYRLEVDTTGLFVLQVAGADQPGPRVPMLIDRPGRQIGIDVQLATRSYKLTFRDENAPAARYAQFATTLTRRRSAFMADVAALKRQRAPEAKLRRFQQTYDWSANHALLRDALARAERPPVREAFFVKYLSATVDSDSALARQALAAVAPASPLWAVWPDALLGALQAVGDTERYNGYVTRVLSTRSNPDLNASLLLWLFQRAQQRGDAERALALREQLAAEYPNTVYAQSLRARASHDAAIRVGAAVPDFDVPALDTTGTPHAPERLKGRVYLIDFWATWCPPCLAEMPVLHRAYKKYEDDGFTILSLSFDESPEAVRTYRQEEQWTMPWLHSFVKEGVDSPVARAFEVVSIPMPVLVGADGTILASGRRLRGPGLIQTLDRVFEDQ